jgi:hypothetical protein
MSGVHELPPSTVFQTPPETDPAYIRFGFVG